jgi:hypothetical protein
MPVLRPGRLILTVPSDPLCSLLPRCAVTTVVVVLSSSDRAIETTIIPRGRSSCHIFARMLVHHPQRQVSARVSATLCKDLFTPSDVQSSSFSRLACLLAHRTKTHDRGKRRNSLQLVLREARSSRAWHHRLNCHQARGTEAARIGEPNSNANAFPASTYVTETFSHPTFGLQAPLMSVQKNSQRPKTSS